jgi:hypothetical protein
MYAIIGKIDIPVDSNHLVTTSNIRARGCLVILYCLLWDVHLPESSRKGSPYVVSLIAILSLLSTTYRVGTHPTKLWHTCW